MRFGFKLHIAASLLIGACLAACPGNLAIAADSMVSAKQTSDPCAELRKFAERQPGPSPKERVDGCLYLLQKEIAHPSEEGYGIVAGPSDSGNVRCAIIGSICTNAQQGSERDEIRRILLSKLTNTPSTDQYMRDVLTIALASTGDKSVLKDIIRILTTHKENYMRLAAANTLRYIAGPAEIPALTRVLHSETYAKVRLECDASKMVYSPIREEVANVLRWRLKQKVEPDAEVLPASYGVKAIEHLLYVDDSATAEQTIEYLRGIGGAESQKALRRLIAMKDYIPFEARVKHAQDALSALTNSTK